MTNNKVLHLDSAFTINKELPTDDEKIESIYIEGYASTSDIDRAGDVVSPQVWEMGLVNYLKNPIILANHDYDDPVGRMVEHKVDAKGLWIKARVSAASEIFSLVKDEVVSTFSIGFRIKDAEYNQLADIFLIKELELLEISIVSVPCNQNTIFNLSKAFSNADDYSSFKQQFAPKGDSAKGLESNKEANRITTKEWKMDPIELQKMLDDTAAKAAAQATKSILDNQAAEKAAADKAAADKVILDAAIKSAVATQIEVGTSGAEKLLADISARFETEAAENKKALAGLESALKEKAEEILLIQKSKMSFVDGKEDVKKDYADRETAVMLSKVLNKSIESTRFGAGVIQKIGAHLPNVATWELEVSLNMESEIRRRLVVSPLVRAINMKTNVMTIPVNPEAGYATWMANTAFGTTASAGAAQTHLLKEITLNAYKVATLEYLAFEEEEDALMALLPIIRDGMIRRVAKAVDRAFLYGAGSGADPVRGLSLYDTTSVVVPTNTGVASIANLRAMRKDLGVWGLDPSEVVYVVSTEIYYDLLDDTNFQTMNQVGNQATLLTGQVGSIGNSPVLVSGEFPTKAGGANTATTNIGAICLAAGNFMAGNQRGLRFDTQNMAETQRQVLVASLRTGLTQLSTVNGAGISTLRWA